MGHEPEKLNFPAEVEVSNDAKDIMRRLLTRRKDRLGTSGGVAEIKSHPFFSAIDWNGIFSFP